jgi:hypothetical protein
VGGKAARGTKSLITRPCYTPESKSKQNDFLSLSLCDPRENVASFESSLCSLHIYVVVERLKVGAPAEFNDSVEQDESGVSVREICVCSGTCY